MNNIPTAEEFYLNPNDYITKKMIEFAKLHLEAVKNLQQSKYYAGETGYITKKEWEDILTNIK